MGKRVLTEEQKARKRATELKRYYDNRTKFLAARADHYAANRERLCARAMDRYVSKREEILEYKVGYRRRKLAETSETIPYLVAEADRLEAIGDKARCREFAETITYDQAWISDRLEDFVCRWLEELE